MLTKVLRLTLPIHLALAAVAFGGFVWIKGRLDASYAASRHPVDYATGQLAFDAEVIAGYYASMTQTGTLALYWQTQVIDFGFIAGVMAVALLLGTLAARLGGRINASGLWGWRLGLAAVALGVSGAGFDAVENLLSFAMLSQAQAIPQGLALAYSAAAATKFALLSGAMLALSVSVVLGLVARVWVWAGRVATPAG